MTAHLGMAVNWHRDRGEAEFITAIQRIRAAGMTGVEPNCPDPALIARAVELCRAEGLTPTALATGRMACHAPGDNGAAAAVLLTAAAEAERAGVPLVVGLLRGRPGTPVDAVLAFLASAVAAALNVHPRLHILLEPINGRETAWPNTLAEGLEALERLKLPRVTLLADTYHLVQSGEMDRWQAAADRIGHVHLAGPKRQPPDGGDPAADIPLAQALRFARQHGKNVSFELADNATVHAQRCAAWAAGIA